MNFGHYIDPDKINASFRRQIVFQENMPAPLADMNYYVSAPSYYAFLQKAFLYANPDIAKRVTRIFETKTLLSRTENVFLNTACVNLSQTGWLAAHNNDVRNTYGLIKEFYQETGTLTSYYGHKHKDYPSTGNKDAMFVCHPVLHRDNDPDLAKDKDQRVKSTFFAYLCDKNILTEDQLYMSTNAMLGVHHREILSEKERLSLR